MASVRNSPLCTISVIEWDRTRAVTEKCTTSNQPVRTKVPISLFSLTSPALQVRDSQLGMSNSPFEHMQSGRMRLMPIFFALSGSQIFHNLDMDEINFRYSETDRLLPMASPHFNQIRRLFPTYDLYYQFHYLGYLWRTEIIANGKLV